MRLKSAHFPTAVPGTCEESLRRLCRSLGGPRNGFWFCLHSWWHCQTLRDSSLRLVGTRRTWLPGGSLCCSGEETACWEALEVLLGLRRTKPQMKQPWLLRLGQIQPQSGWQRHYLKSRSLQGRWRSFPVGSGKPEQTDTNWLNGISAEEYYLKFILDNRKKCK